ncbi:MAG: FAD-binding protein [Myxococcota bacterium]|nr:FAD-binding protein [Myxococcota bacterium]
MGGWGSSVDVLVVGSGGAGHCAALRARDLDLDVLLVEKLPRWGGNTAMSAGAIWIPAHPWAPQPDSEDEGVRYLRAALRDGGSEAQLRAFVREGGRMLAYLVERSRLRLRCMETYPDYHDELPGGRAGGRGLETEPIDGELLADDFATLEAAYPGELMMGKFMMAMPEARRLLEPGLSPYLAMSKGMLGYALRARRRARLGGRDPYLTMGQALMARMRLSLRDRKVPMWLEAPLTDLVVEGGRVVGAVVRRGAREVRVEARRGVVIAAGGFERNDALRERYHRAPSSASWSAGSAGNTGDGILIGERIGARLDTAQMHEAWWTPATRPPGDDYNAVMVIEKSLPHGIFVNRRGERFTNEAASYTAVVQAMYADHAATGANVPCWWVIDATYRKRYPMGPVEPASITSDAQLAKKRPRWAPGAGWLHRAATLDELATQIAVPAAALRATVERFNAHARAGEDRDFGRGASANDRYYSDARVRPNPSLGSIETAPFYAVQVFPSDLGTKGGLATDPGGRVLDTSDRPIPGLYAAGNSKTSAMGDAYPGPGVTIAEALTSGFLAAESIAADVARR